MTEQQEEQRRYALSQCGGVCEVCGKPLGAHAQAAHRIANTEPNRRKWGAWIIDSPLNVGYTCSLECNQSLNIGMDKGACLELVQKILRYEQKKFVDPM